MADELVQQAGGGVWQAAVDAESLAAVLQVLVALFALERQRNLDFGGLLQAFDERDAAERGSEVDVKFDAIGAIRVVPES